MSAAARRQGAVIGLEDALALADALPTVSEAAPRIQSDGSFRYAGKGVGSGSLQGVSASFASVNRLRTVEGRFVSDLDTGRYFAVVGADVAQAMRRRGAGDIVGEILEIDERLCTVVGVLADTPGELRPALPGGTRTSPCSCRSPPCGVSTQARKSS